MKEESVVDFHVHPVDNASTVVEHTGYAKSGTLVVWARDARKRGWGLGLAELCALDFGFGEQAVGGGQRTLDQ